MLSLRVVISCGHVPWCSLSLSWSPWDPTHTPATVWSPLFPSLSPTSHSLNPSGHFHRLDLFYKIPVQSLIPLPSMGLAPLASSRKAAHFSPSMPSLGFGALLSCVQPKWPSSLLSSEPGSKELCLRHFPPFTVGKCGPWAWVDSSGKLSQWKAIPVDSSSSGKLGEMSLTLDSLQLRGRTLNVLGLLAATLAVLKMKSPCV